MKAFTKGKHKLRIALGVLGFSSVALVSVSFSVAGFSYTQDHKLGVPVKLDMAEYFGKDTEKVYQSNANAFGTGSKKFPYIISNLQHLLNLQILNSMGIFNANDYFVLYNDIDCAQDKTIFKAPPAIMPIGTRNSPFYSTFDGCCYSIKNLSIAGVGQDMGLFGYVGESGVIKNFILESPCLAVKNYYNDTDYYYYLNRQGIYSTQTCDIASTISPSEFNNTTYDFENDSKIYFGVNGVSKPNKIVLNNGKSYDWDLRVNGANLTGNKKVSNSFIVGTGADKGSLTIKPDCADGYYTIDLVLNYDITYYSSTNSIESFSKTGRYCFERFRVFVNDGKFDVLPDNNLGNEKARQLLFGQNTKYRENTTNNYQIRLSTNYVGLVCGWLDGTASGIGVSFDDNSFDHVSHFIIETFDGIKTSSLNLFVGRINDQVDGSFYNHMKTNDYNQINCYLNNEINGRVIDSFDLTNTKFSPNESITTAEYNADLKNLANPLGRSKYFQAYDLDPVLSGNFNPSYYANSMAQPFQVNQYKLYNSSLDNSGIFKNSNYYSGAYYEQYSPQDYNNSLPIVSTNSDHQFQMNAGDTYLDQSLIKGVSTGGWTQGTGFYSVRQGDRNATNPRTGMEYNNDINIIDDNGVKIKNAQMLTSSGIVDQSFKKMTPLYRDDLVNGDFNDVNDKSIAYSMMFHDVHQHDKQKPLFSYKINGFQGEVTSNSAGVTEVGKAFNPGELTLKIGGSSLYDDFFERYMSNKFESHEENFYVDIDLEYLYLADTNKASAPSRDELIEEGPKFMVYTSFEADVEKMGPSTTNLYKPDIDFNDYIYNIKGGNDQLHLYYTPYWTQKGYWGGRCYQEVQMAPGAPYYQAHYFCYGIADPMPSSESNVNKQISGTYLPTSTNPSLSALTYTDDIGYNAQARSYTGVTSALGYVQDDGGCITINDDSDTSRVPNTQDKVYDSMRYYTFNPDDDLTFKDDYVEDNGNKYYQTKHKKIRLCLTPNHTVSVRGPGGVMQNLSSADVVSFYKNPTLDTKATSKLPVILIPFSTDSDNSQFFIKGVDISMSTDSEYAGNKMNGVKSVYDKSKWVPPVDSNGHHLMDTFWNSHERDITRNYFGYSNYINFSSTSNWTTSLVDLNDGKYTDTFILDTKLIRMRISLKRVAPNETLFVCDYWTANHDIYDHFNGISATGYKNNDDWIYGLHPVLPDLFDIGGTRLNSFIIPYIPELGLPD